MLEELTIRISRPCHENDFQPCGTSLHARSGANARTEVRLSRLTTLYLGYDDREAAIAFLRTVRFPSVRQLTLYHEIEYADNDWDAGPILEHCAQGLAPISPDKHTRLSTLTLHNFTARSEAFALFYASVPRLTSLTLTRTTACAVEALQPQFPHPDEPRTVLCPCPRLQSLRIHHCNDEYLLASCSRMLEDRAGVGMHVPEVCFDVPEGLPREDEGGGTLTLTTLGSARDQSTDPGV